MTYTTEDILIRLAAGLVIGFCMGLTGVGSGVLVLPTLTFLGLPPVTCVGTAGLYGFLTRCSATMHHAKLKNIDYRISVLFLVGAIPGTMLVSHAVNTFVANGSPEAVKAFEHNFKLFIAAVVFFAVIMLVINLVTAMRQRSPDHAPTQISVVINNHPVLRNVAAPLAGLIVGGLIGASSVVGALLIPTLILIFGLAASTTVGTATIIAVVLTLAMTLVFAKGGNIDYGSAILMTAGSLSGVAWGSKLSARVPEKLLKTIMIAVILIAAIMMITTNGDSQSAASTPRTGLPSNLPTSD